TERGRSARRAESPPKDRPHEAVAEACRRCSQNPDRRVIPARSCSKYASFAVLSQLCRNGGRFLYAELYGDPPNSPPCERARTMARRVKLSPPWKYSKTCRVKLSPPWKYSKTCRVKLS